MARTSITVQALPGFGGEIDTIVWTSADQANGMQFVNDGRTILLARNTSGGARNITVKTITFQGRTGDKTVTVPADVGGANGCSIAGPFKKILFNQSTGVVHLNFDSDTGLKVACVRVKNPLP